MKIKSLVWLALPALMAVSCKEKAKENKRTVFFDAAGMDSTVSPGDNFFQYANGKWYKNTKIPASQTGWGSFYTLFEDNQKVLKKILDKVSTEKHDDGTLEQKVADLYASGIDTLAINKLGFEPIKPELQKIDAVKNYKELLTLLASDYKNGNGAMLGFYIGPDDKNSTKNVLNFVQTGLGLPNRDYYFNNDANTQNIRKEYVKYIAKLFTLTGIDAAKAEKDAQSILTLETKIAASHATPVELRDPVKNYHKFSITELQKVSPELDFKNILNNLGMKTDTVLMGQPKYFETLGKLMASEPIDLWKSKIRFAYINSAANYLSSDFENARFNFYGKTLSGQQQKDERWKTMVNQVDGGLGELLGQLYVKEYFTPEAKERMLKLVNNLQKVYQSRIENLDWMSAETKQKALAKLNAFTKKIGYPDKWKSYDDVTINKGAYYQNMVSIDKHNYNESLKKLNKAVDKTEWGMTPPTVNAYYNPSFNEIVFPAGILQFPFFDFDADDAINYGAIGAVIGHEMTHGFDDQGRQYDKDGNLKDWWTKEDADKFKTKADVVVNQYNNFSLLDNQHVNGALTLGENLADIGGLAIAYQAFKLTEQGKGETKIDGFTPDQRFFLAFAQVWRIKNRDETLRLRLKTDPHSPEEFRVNGPLSNMPEFYKAFNVKEGSKMYRKPIDRVKVW
ncbi:M13 family metallopeptidase [Pelobium sp.]|nr:M13 family metallopeptidase [Pelobium sp.]MDA9554792.1 M13 family metallopeptidase [Pelobium sp.]